MSSIIDTCNILNVLQNFWENSGRNNFTCTFSTSDFKMFPGWRTSGPCCMDTKENQLELAGKMQRRVALFSCNWWSRNDPRPTQQYFPTSGQQYHCPLVIAGLLASASIINPLLQDVTIQSPSVVAHRLLYTVFQN